MADWHLVDIDHALTQSGWSVVERRVGDDYRISAYWVLRHAEKDSEVTIEFDGLDDMNCLPIEKSYGCKVTGRNETGLYFRKPGSIWKKELADFILLL